MAILSVAPRRETGPSASVNGSTKCRWDLGCCGERHARRRRRKEWKEKGGRAGWWLKGWLVRGKVAASRNPARPMQMVEGNQETRVRAKAMLAREGRTRMS